MLVKRLLATRRNANEGSASHMRHALLLVQSTDTGKGMSEAASRKRKRQRTPNNRTTTGLQVSDELWAVLRPLLPTHVNTHRLGGGTPTRS